MMILEDPPLLHIIGEPINIATEVVKGRKSWKRAKGERVWPPELEAALIEGLQNYRPVDSRETRLLGRFPMRNRFLSDYILQKTGERRTAKQVGSRLQQLRDPRSGKRLMKLLSHNMHDYDSAQGVDQWLPSHCDDLRSQLPPLRCELSPSGLSPSYPSSPTTPDDNTMLSPLSPTVVSIDILPFGLPWPSSSTSRSSSPQRAPNSVGHDVASGTASGSTLSDSVTVFQPSPRPRPLWAIDPTVTFIGRSSMSATSFFSVTLDGNVVHTDMVELDIVRKSSHEIGDSVFYRASLVPAYWNVICESRDPTRYRITQDVYPGPCPDLATSSVSDIRGRDPKLFSAIYEFKYPSNVSAQPSQPICTPKFFDESFCTELEILDNSAFLELLPTDCLPSSDLSPSLDDAQYTIYPNLVSQNVHDGRQDAHLPNTVSNSLTTPEDFGCYLAEDTPPSLYASCLPVESPDYASTLEQRARF